ncbi:MULTISPECIES: hypothetical protein [unclassified Streptomyces]|uniref:hypothetical protein n=1 Tax=unclassified Streptomyces TaxID=2593676 RepID=UPI00278BE3CB|nr:MULTISPECIES: hypothetical protein [unclassified Streptomyces]
MFEYELHQIRSAELIKEAERFRLARSARTQAKARRAERRQHDRDAEGRVSSGGTRGQRAPRTA